MLYIIMGSVGFAILYMVDYFTLKRKRFMKLCTWFSGLMFIGYSHLKVIFSNSKLSFYPLASDFGWIIGIVMFALLVYTVFIEIPLIQKKTKHGREGNKLVTTGTYAMMRHPGVLWYMLMLVGLIFATGSKKLLLAFPVWSIMDIVYVIIQEKLFFVKLFGDEYVKYQKEVPMIFPSISRIKRSFFSVFNNKVI